MAKPDGSKKNELYEGFDAHFGFHLYKALADPQGTISNSTLSPQWDLPHDHLGFLTNEGSMKRLYIKHSAGSFWRKRAKETALAKETASAKEADPEEAAVQAEDAAQTEESHSDDEMTNTESYSGTDSANGYDSHEDNDDYEDDFDYDYDAYEDYDDDDPYPFPDFETKAEFEAARMDQLTEEYERADYLAALALTFACEDAYFEACGRFVALFGKARPDVLRGFYQELEDIVNLYLAERNLSPLMDTDKTLDVYSSVYDGPCQKADSYERRLQWENQ